MSANPLCCLCEAEGRLTAAEHVDHIKPHHGDREIFWDASNWQPLCRPCHSRKTAGETRSSVALLPKWIGTPVKPLTVVCGPPASGKSTYVAEHAGPCDLVLDADEIAKEIGEAPSRDADSGDQLGVIAALRERNQRLADFARGRTRHPKCWLIATAGSFKQRKFWTDLGAEVIVINPGAFACKQRIRSENSTDFAKRSRLRGVDRWS